jgi:hypothetical protein
MIPFPQWRIENALGPVPSSQAFSTNIDQLVRLKIIAAVQALWEALQQDVPQLSDRAYTILPSQTAHGEWAVWFGGLIIRDGLPLEQALASVAAAESSKILQR